MALYEVTRVDTVQPGEFNDALVIARGAARARAAVAHLLPAGAEVMAVQVDTNGARVGTKLLGTYFDQREAAPAEITDPLFA